MIRRGWSRHANGLRACLSGGSTQANPHQPWRLKRDRRSVSTDEGPGNADELPGPSSAGPRGVSKPKSNSALPKRSPRVFAMAAGDGDARKRKGRILTTKGGNTFQGLAKLHRDLRKEKEAEQRQQKENKQAKQGMLAEKLGGEHDSTELEGVKADDDATSPEVVWPQLKRKQGPNVGHYRFKNHPTRARPAVQRPAHSNNPARLMLLIDGLSPNLHASDFYRLGPSSLSEWKSAIKKVQQKRDPVTFEAHGQYYVTFNSYEAAVAYQDRLIRLHRLSALKLKSATGLWESAVPSNLKARLVREPPASGVAEVQDVPDDDAAAATSSSSASSGDDLNKLVESFTLAPASLSPIYLKRKRVDITHPWGPKLAEIVQPLGFGDKPAVILVDVYPPTMTSKELLGFILMDGFNRGIRWQTTTPYHLRQQQQQPPRPVVPDPAEGQEQTPDQEYERMKALFLYKDPRTAEKLKGRFLLVAANESEAYRFQRSWNNRRLTTSQIRRDRFIVHASIINW